MSQNETTPDELPEDLGEAASDDSGQLEQVFRRLKRKAGQEASWLSSLPSLWPTWCTYFSLATNRP